MRPQRMTNTEKYAGGRGGETEGVLRSEKRGSGRLRCSKVTCSLGAVCDLSASGARIACRKKPTIDVGGTVTIELSIEEQSVSMPAKVIWIRVQEDCSFQLGLRFEDMDPLRKRQLIGVVQTGLDSEGLTRGWAPLNPPRRANWEQK